MSCDIRIAVIGGDKRLMYMAQRLAESGCFVTTYFVENESLLKNVRRAHSMGEALTKAHIVVTPVPFSKDGVHIFSKAPSELTMKEFFHSIKENQIIFGGNIPKVAREEIEKRNATFFDFMEMEDIALKNAVATAEGTIAEAISLSDRNISDSKCLVLGFGKCGKTLAFRLTGLCGKVTVAARRQEQRNVAGECGFTVLPLKNLENHMQRFDFVFNTIPAKVIREEHIRNMSRDAVIIDIASKPGGTDFTACARYQIPAVLALGLPGKYSPKTSADILIQAMGQKLSPNQSRSIS